MDALLFILKFISLLIQSFICYWFLNGEMVAGAASIYLFFLSMISFFILFVGMISLSPVVKDDSETEIPKLRAFNSDRLWNEIFLFIVPMTLSTAFASRLAGNDRLLIYPFGLITLVLMFFSFKKKFS